MTIAKEKKALDKEYYTQTEVKELGFTNKMIKELLPPPAFKQNPMYRNAAPMKL